MARARSASTSDRPGTSPARPNFMGWTNPGWAVITGASSGIGEEFARQLAAQGFSLLLIARRTDRLDALARSLRDSGGTVAEVCGADLGRLDEITRVAARIGDLKNLDILVNNAGFGPVGAFFECDLERQLSMLNVHAAAPTVLTRNALPRMIRRNRGVVIFTASLAAFVPSPNLGLYTPTKAFLAGLARTLVWELRGTDVRVQALCPGFTRTEFHNDPAYEGLKSFLPRYAWGTSRAVVRASLRGACRRRCIVVPGFMNRLSLKLVPKKLMLGVYMKNLWPESERPPSTE